MLVDKKKFDMRVYVAVFGLDPMYAYLYKEGMVRICTETYKKPTWENKSNNYMHLSNFSLNKNNKDFDWDSENSNKWTLSSIIPLLEK